MWMIIIRNFYYIIRFVFLKIGIFLNLENRWDFRIIFLGKDFYVYFFWVIYIILYFCKMIYVS